ncbi:hypothetical protein CC85DRAFT_256762 [Cutaneotrichosporon oleaginosum]|uniref:Helicase C-terminal domain-containing protein n=1 Tax=Cutaneotrichosporon oleaginosum TaxID=879819 RepID=A0A0J0XTT9_9TREE|nr:uncharacterized protein CC85DRAFT_256762 [Cutaneotrichosporon oleaginosum]KLT44493.1 hypothetical protein CC85DRAFT_256762 [Cutaneotrichosporon oleaginosum]TXT13989.1 hypothetical protein COLE_00182 [Cutaneotrichosporon oleaginosum]
MSRLSSATNILMEMRKLFQHPYLVAPEMDNPELSQEEQHKQLIDASGKLLFLKQLLPRLKERGHRVLLFSQFKIALNLIEDFLCGEGYKYLRLDGDVNQLHRQKDMDKFNAPNSDYFIFLLTTRAGGVGINLASADTVIVHDPDFNPHQDLQAISRAHRFGQTKRVLVFKLMMENSAEVRIINSGKKKLVLDHLVVQQLGKDREEGEYENLILYGAEDITKIDEDASDMRVWTSKMIDDLIDDAEKEAEEAAKAQEEADAAKAVPVAADEASKARGFSFAKIWETKAKEVAAPVLDEPEEEPDFDEHGWLQFLQQVEATEAAQREQARAVAGRLRALKKIKYNLERTDFGDTSPEKQKKKGKGKEKMQTAVDDTDGDDDFVPLPELSDEDDMDTPGGPTDLEDLSNDQRRIIGGIAAGQRKLTKHERALLRKWHSLDEKRRAEASASASVPAAESMPVNIPLTNVSSATVSQAEHTSQQVLTPHLSASLRHGAPPPAAGPGPATAEQRALTSARPSQSPLVAAAIAGELIGRVANGEVLTMTVPPSHGEQVSSSDLVRWPSIRMMAEPKHSELIASGRALLIALYRALQATDNPVGYSADWGELVKVNTLTATRKDHYVRLARVADQHRATTQNNKDRSFSAIDAVGTAFYFIDALAPINPPPPRPPPVAQTMHPLTIHHRPGPAGTLASSSDSIAPAPFATHFSSHGPHLSTSAWAPAGYYSSAIPRPPPSMPPYHSLPQQHMSLHVQHPGTGSVPHYNAQRAPVAPIRPAPPQSQAVYYHQPPESRQTREQPLSSQLPQSSSARWADQPHPSIQSHQPAPANAHLSQTQRQDVLGPSSVQASAAPARPVDLRQPRPQDLPQPSSVQTPAAPPLHGTSKHAIIHLSGGPVKDSGAQPVVLSAMQLGDSSRFDPQFLGAQSEEADHGCYWCQQDHLLRDCPALLSLEDIGIYRRNIEASDESIDAKERGLRALARMEVARRERDAIYSRRSRKRASDHDGTANDPIEIDLEASRSPSPDTGPASKRARVEPTFQGCRVCNGEVAHALAACPVVLAGADSIKRALGNFDPGSPTHDMLLKFLRAAEIGVPAGALEPCAYCNTSCGMTVRQCAEVRGKRKDLKHKIRHIDEHVLPSTEEQLRVLRSRRLTTADWELPSLERQIADTEKEVHRLERVLARLYEAYSQWPNLKRPSDGKGALGSPDGVQKTS